MEFLKGDIYAASGIKGYIYITLYVTYLLKYINNPGKQNVFNLFQEQLT